MPQGTKGRGALFAGGVAAILASTCCLGPLVLLMLGFSGAEPGGPHRIMECGWPDSNATRSGFPGPSRCFCPTMSSSDCGRSFSASGAAG